VHRQYYCSYVCLNSYKVNHAVFAFSIITITFCGCLNAKIGLTSNITVIIIFHHNNHINKQKNKVLDTLQIIPFFSWVCVCVSIIYDDFSEADKYKQLLFSESAQSI